jgi:hypothetical protein
MTREEKIKLIFNTLPSYIILDDIGFHLNILVTENDYYLPQAAYYGDNDEWIILPTDDYNVFSRRKRLLIAFFEEIGWLHYSSKNKKIAPEIFEINKITRDDLWNGKILLNKNRS